MLKLLLNKSKTAKKVLKLLKTSYISTFLHSNIPTFLHSYISTFLHSYIPTFHHPSFIIHHPLRSLELIMWSEGQWKAFQTMTKTTYIHTGWRAFLLRPQLGWWPNNLLKRTTEDATNMADLVLSLYIQVKAQFLTFFVFFTAKAQTWNFHILYTDSSWGLDTPPPEK